MIAYDQKKLNALKIQDSARDWHRAGLLSHEKWKAIVAGNPADFYSPNVFIRIGLGIFTLILLFAGTGMGALVAGSNSDESIALLSLIFGFLTIAVLESWVIRAGRHYGSGVDDMALYFAAGLFLTSVFILLPSSMELRTYFAIALPIFVVGTIRYLDRMMAMAAFGCALMVVLLTVKEIPNLALYLMPFAGMLFSAGIYFFAKKGQARYAWRYWEGVLTVLELLSLVTFYASGNFWVIQQAGAEWLQLEQVPMASFFWIFTFAVPSLYIFGGLYRKDRHLLDLGLACIGAAVFTFRTYFHVVSLAWASTIAGAVLFATSYFSIRYLRNNARKFTFEADGDTTMLQEMEEQLIEQTIASQNAPGTAEKPESFGGGQFGGGGASGDF